MGVEFVANNPELAPYIQVSDSEDQFEGHETPLIKIGSRPNLVSSMAESWMGKIKSAEGGQSSYALSESLVAGGKPLHEQKDPSQRFSALSNSNDQQFRLRSVGAFEARQVTTAQKKRSNLVSGTTKAESEALKRPN